MVKRKRYRFRQGDVIDVEEFHDGKYGGPGTGRAKRAKPTEEQMRAVNAQNKAKRCRQRMLEYFKEGDIFATWTYEVRNRPPDMQAALKDFQKAMRYVRREFKKRGYEVFCSSFLLFAPAQLDFSLCFFCTIRFFSGSASCKFFIDRISMNADLIGYISHFFSSLAHSLNNHSVLIPESLCLFSCHYVHILSENKISVQELVFHSCTLSFSRRK